MFGFVFIYWIWKGFSNLAISYNKNKWKYFIIGLVSYFGFSFVIAVVFMVIMGFVSGFDLVGNGEYDSPAYNICFSVLGGLCCYGVYKLLERKGEKERELAEKEGIESIGLMGEN